jgi:hypothetical protein
MAGVPMKDTLSELPNEATHAAPYGRFAECIPGEPRASTRDARDRESPQGGTRQGIAKLAEDLGARALSEALRSGEMHLETERDRWTRDPPFMRDPSPRRPG